MSDVIEVFLLVEQPRQRLGHWSQALASLDSPNAPPLSAIHAYYDATCDQALIELSYDPIALGEQKLAFVIEVALLAEVGMVQPAELTEMERMRFLGERLSRCKLSVTYQRSVVGGLVELVKRIKDGRRPAAVPPPIPKLAKGTRDNLERQAHHAMTTSRHVIPRANRSQTAEIEPLMAERLATQAAAVDEHEAPTAPLIVDVAPPTFDGIGATPYLPASMAVDTGVIHARYLRSGRWVPVRVGALSLKHGAMLTGALPRLDDHVDIALSYGSHRALVRGTVAKVSTVREAAATGAATFSVDFELDLASRRQLTALLTAARAGNVVIKPAPARATRRFPVDWPVTLGTIRGPVKAEALDVSAGGLFVRPSHPLQRDAILNTSIVLDDGGAPIAPRAKVVRHIGDALSRQCGIPAGYGLGIVEMSESDRMRWLAFLARIERRAEKRVLVGASPERLAELQAGLAGCGYSVLGGSDPGALVQLARADDRPADAALLDAGWLSNGASASWVESLFSARNVPFVTLQGDARRARQAIDRLLEVVV
jgi:hypothetical protein